LLIFETEKINKDYYLRVIRRYLTLNLGFDGYHQFLLDWDIIIVPVELQELFEEFYKDLPLETSSGMAWGVTQPPTTHQKGMVYCFVRDTSNMFIIRSNFVKIGHELAHAIGYTVWGTRRGIREFADPQARAGTEGPMYVTIVHDLYYGHQKFRTFWIRFGFAWVPVKMLAIWEVIH